MVFSGPEFFTQAVRNRRKILFFSKLNNLDLPQSCNMDFPKAEQYIRELLQTQLSPILTYHDYDHTLDVVAAAEALAIQENITDPVEMTLLKTAALFHDCGYVNVYEQHEEESCHIARQVLPGFGYNEAQVQQICDMIMKTRLNAVPATHLEKILCDADLDYLGGDQFESRGQKLFSEWIAYGKLRDEKEWNEKQIRFLESHRFYTNSASSKGERKKAEYLRKLRNDVNV
jgi:uncharacterized protein